jgi:hypothetical protein
MGAPGFRSAATAYEITSVRTADGFAASQQALQPE